MDLPKNNMDKKVDDQPVQHQHTTTIWLENKEESVNKKRKVFYGKGDVIIQCPDGSMKVNKALLSFKSEVFYDMFFKSEEEKASFSLPDESLENLKWFLDCLFGFQEISPEIALNLFPIAHKYQARELLENCIEKLIPKEVNENACLALNLAVLYDCEILCKSILDFLKNTHEDKKDQSGNQNVRAKDIFLNEKYLNLLEPNAVLKILDIIYIDESVIYPLCNWGENYLCKKGNFLSLRTFFSENKILDKLSLKNFSSSKSALQFIDNSKTKDFFSDKEVLNFLKTEILPKIEGEWISVQKGEEITEIFTFEDVIPKVCFRKESVYNCYIITNETEINSPCSSTASAIDSCSVVVTLQFKNGMYKDLVYSISDRRRELECFQENSFATNGKKFFHYHFVLAEQDQFYIQKVKISYKCNKQHPVRIFKNKPKDLVSKNLNDKNSTFFTYAIRSSISALTFNPNYCGNNLSSYYKYFK